MARGKRDQESGKMRGEEGGRGGRGVVEDCGRVEKGQLVKEGDRHGKEESCASTRWEERG